MFLKSEELEILQNFKKIDKPDEFVLIISNKED